MRDEYYEYEKDDINIPAEYDEDPYDYTGHEPARNAVERFLEEEAGDFLSSGYERTSRPPMPTETEDTTWELPDPRSEGDEDYMTRLANARIERQRRKEQIPTPKPAVRVNVERKRSFAVSQPQERDDTEPMDEADFDSFRQRYSSDVVSQPKEAREKLPRSRGPAKAEPKETGSGDDGPNPLKYLVAIVFVGLLGLMTFLAANNRGLRRDIDEYRVQAAGVVDTASEISSLAVQVSSYRDQVARLQNIVEDLERQLDAVLGPAQNEYPPGDDDYTPANDGAPHDPGPAGPAEPVVHIVQAGEMLSRIARQHFGSNDQRYIDMIVAANNLSDPNAIFEGQRLYIPPRE